MDERPDGTSRAKGPGLDERLGYVFRDAGLLRTALTHASYAHEQGLPPAAHYDRLEFLGDAVVDLILADHEVRADAGADSGELSRRRARLARRPSLAAAGAGLGLGEEVRVSGGERAQGGPVRRRLLADLYEAVVGAIYLDGGIEAASAFVRRTLIAPAEGTGPSAPDPKSALQEREQGLGRPAPVYRVIEQAGPSHDPVFLVAVELGGRIAGQGMAGSKREAEQQAARVALAGERGPGTGSDGSGSA